jgi:cytochrome P450
VKLSFSENQANFVETITVCVYRIFFHPLARYPGPWLAKVSNSYAAWHAYKGDIHVDMWRCHQKYGKVVRYAPNRVLINSAEAVRDIYSHKSNVVKSQTYDALVHRAPNILTLRDKRQHGRRRRVMSQALSDASITASQDDILQQVTKFVSSLARLPRAHDNSEWSAPINMARPCDSLTFDMMAKLVFSAEYDMLGSPAHRPVLDAILDSNVRMGTLFQYPALEKWKAHKRLFPAAIAARGVFVGFVTRMVTDRVKLAKADGQAEKKRLDVFGRLSAAADPETGSALTLNELGAESTTLIVAGSDTTSTALAATLYYLAQHPAARQRAQREVRDVFASADAVRLGSALSGCAFLAACIQEAMRLSPPVGASLWRQALPGGARVDGELVPAGCDVGAGIYSVQRLEGVYAAPGEFRPERWMVSDAAEREALTAAFSPFSRGPRSCVGKGLAMAELMLTMGRVCFELDWQFEGGKQVEGSFVLKDHVTGTKQGPVLEFRTAQGGLGWASCDLW